MYILESILLQEKVVELSANSSSPNRTPGRLHSIDSFLSKIRSYDKSYGMVKSLRRRLLIFLPYHNYLEEHKVST